MANWLYLAAAIVAEVIATSALKSSDGFRRLVPSVLVVVGYSTAFFLLSLALRAIPVAIAYAVWSGVGVALITIVGWVLFDQKLDAAGAVGIGLIVSGVIVLNVFTRTTGH
jgi:small multidrug resistance pump